MLSAIIKEQSPNKVIMKNTIVVYFRIFITMFIGLFSSRFVLLALGESDFGLYTVVGGIITMFTFISGSLSNSTTRFLNHERGLENGDVNKIFNVSIFIHVIFAVIALLIAESVGLFYIYNYLNIASDKMPDAIFVFHTSTIVACVGIIGIPYQSLFVSHEHFKTVALIDISQSILKFAMVLGLLYIGGNHLRAYALSMALITGISTLCYVIIGIRKWPEYIKFNFVKEKAIYKELLTFNNYNLLGVGSLMLRSQGSIMLINYFFGTVVNAAYAIANSVQSYVNIFVGNFDAASSPQIMQNLSAGRVEKSIAIVCRTCRICILLMCVIYFPLSVELDTVLNLWLSEVPEGTEIFCKYTLLIAVISSTSGGLVQFILGYGKIKWFQIEYSILYISCIPIGYFLFMNGYPAYYITILFIVADAISRVIQLLLLKRAINFNILFFIKKSYIRPFLVFCIMSIYSHIYRLLPIEGLRFRLIGIAATGIICCVLVCFLGLYKEERQAMFKLIKVKL